MTGPIGDGRLADLHRRYDGLGPDAYAPDHPVSHVVELLAYVDELRRENEQRAADELTRMDEVMVIEAAVHAARHEALAERDQARAQVADYENRITWHTTCQQCAITLDKAIADHERAEQAVAERDQARNLARKALAEMGFGFDEANAEALELDTLPDWLTEGH